MARRVKRQELLAPYSQTGIVFRMKQHYRWANLILLLPCFLVPSLQCSASFTGCPCTCLTFGASSHASSSVAPSQSGSRLPQRNAAYRTSAFAHFILSCRGNHSFLLSQPGLLLFRVMLLEICGDVSGYCSAWGCFCTQWAAGSSHNKCPPELGKFPCQEGLSYSKS